MIFKYTCKWLDLNLLHTQCSVGGIFFNNGYFCFQISNLISYKTILMKEQGSLYIYIKYFDILLEYSSSVQ